jgi:hypothetical protein
MFRPFAVEVFTGAISVGFTVMMGEMQLSMTLDVRVITYLSVTTLATRPFAGTSVNLRCVAENGWRFRIWTNCPWNYEAVTLLDRLVWASLPRPIVGNHHWVNRNVAAL